MQKALQRKAIDRDDRLMWAVQNLQRKTVIDSPDITHNAEINKSVKGEIAATLFERWRCI